MKNDAQRSPDAPADDGVELLARAVELFEDGDVYQARGLARQGRAQVSDPEAIAEADALLAKLDLDRVPMLAALALLIFVLIVAAVAAS